MAYAQLLGRVRRELAEFEQTDITVVPGWQFNQGKTLRRIELYYNGQFETGSTDSEGFHKFFFNVVRFPVDVAVKAVDLDTKDFRLIPESAEAQLPTLFLQKELRDWMKATHFGTTLNEMVQDYPKYGTTVVKTVGGGLRTVNLHNLANDQTVRNLVDSPYVIETHVYTPEELVEAATEGGWDLKAVYRVISLYATGNEPRRIYVRERWGYLNTSDYKAMAGSGDTADPIVYCMSIVAGVEKYAIAGTGEDKTQVEQGECLYFSEASKEDFPYYDTHWEQVRGRWLGIGLVERNFEAQVRRNELVNVKAKALHWTSRVLFQSKDKTIARNLLSDMRNGDILRVESDLAQIPTATQDLAAFQTEEQAWEANVQQAGFTFESQSGEALPSGTPFRLGALQNATSSGFFNFKRENLGLFLRTLFLDEIIPAFKDAKRRKHILAIPKEDKDLEMLHNRYADVIIYARVQDYIEATGFIPTSEQLAAERQRIIEEMQRRKNFFTEIPDNYYKNAKFSMDMVITDEQIDMGQRLESLANLIQLVGTNPGILEDPRTRNMVFAALNLAGVSPVELGIDQPPPQGTGMPGPAALAAMGGTPAPQSAPAGQGVPTQAPGSVAV